MNIETFKSAFESLAKPTHFKVYGFGAGRELEFLCKAASLPATTIGVIEVPYMGRKIKYPGDRTYAEWTITIMNDSSFTTRNYFEDWASRINNPVTNIGIGDPATIKEDGYIDQLDANGNVLATYQMIGAWPMEVGSIETGWESTDTVEEYTVNLAYDYFVRAK